jgi:hypothetical protein
MRGKMRAFIAMTLYIISTLMTGSALAEQSFNPARCTHYSDCIRRAGPYCQKDAASEPVAMRDKVYKDCLARYHSTCREIHCD